MPAGGCADVADAGGLTPRPSTAPTVTLHGRFTTIEENTTATGENRITGRVSCDDGSTRRIMGVFAVARAGRDGAGPRA
ncbi:hypothetical protein PSD17_57390 [Pseudonocardia sp. D17]|nr:hypothetical protein PSD17_57390 [Pseudonocardia sp. D17]